MREKLYTIFLISIHALREEGDASGRQRHHQRRISIHALREEGDSFITFDKLTRRRFLSTPSARRATTTTGQMIAVPDNFYPRPPRGGRRLAPVPRFALRINFYPRPPRGGRRHTQRKR